MAQKPRAKFDDIVDFLYELGPVNHKDEVTFMKIDFAIFENKRKTPHEIELFLTESITKSELNFFKGGIFTALRGHFVGLNVTEYNGFKALKWPNGILYFDVEQDEDGGSGTVPANIHESGTAAVFSRALSSKKPFKTEDDLQKDEDLNKELKIIFGKKWEHRIGDWIHSYYEQQQAALQEYSKPSWEEFKHGDGSFTEFFRDHMDKLHRDLNPVIKVGIYERWNPSDLWAVKKNKMDKIKKELEKQISPQTVLTELNSILIGLMENNDLVGISLKKIEKKQSGHIRLYNVDTSAALKALNSYANLETFTMNDISFEPDNILLAKNVTTYVRIGARGKYAVSITRSGNNISFTSQIKGTAAQGGQAPLELVVKLLNAKEFNPSHNFYPKDEDVFVKQTTKYKKLYTKVAQFASSRSQRMKFEDWQLKIVEQYIKDPKDAKAMLMQLSFWFDAVTNFPKNSEFWTDLLYYGMKVTSKGMFAPHAKIS